MGESCADNLSCLRHPPTSHLLVNESGFINNCKKRLSFADGLDALDGRLIEIIREEGGQHRSQSRPTQYHPAEPPTVVHLLRVGKRVDQHQGEGEGRVERLRLEGYGPADKQDQRDQDQPGLVCLGGRVPACYRHHEQHVEEGADDLCREVYPAVAGCLWSYHSALQAPGKHRPEEEPQKLGDPVQTQLFPGKLGILL